MAEAFAGAPLRIYDEQRTIESAFVDLAHAAAAVGLRAAMFTDSIQTVTCSGEEAAKSVREAVTMRVRAIRSMATVHRVISFAVTEMNRGAYRSIAAAEESNDLAAAKETSAIEYSARVMVALRKSAEQDVVQLRIAKNKHGPTGTEFYMRLDRQRMTLSETTAPTMPDREEQGGVRGKKRNVRDGASVAVAVAENPGIGRRALETKLKAAHGTFDKARVDVGIEVLGSALHLGKVGTAKNSPVRYRLDGSKVASDVMAAIVDDQERARVAASKPHTSE